MNERMWETYRPNNNRDDLEVTTVPGGWVVTRIRWDQVEGGFNPAACCFVPDPTAAHVIADAAKAVARTSGRWAMGREQKTRPYDLEADIRDAQKACESTVDEIATARERVERLKFELGYQTGRRDGMKAVQEAWSAVLGESNRREDEDWRRGYDDAGRDVAAFMRKHSRKSVKWLRNAIENGQHLAASDEEVGDEA